VRISHPVLRIGSPCLTSRAAVAENELEDVKLTFKALSKKSGDNTIDRQTFLEHFAKAGIDNSWQEALFRSFDTKGDGFIDVEEFFRGMAICARGLVNEKLSCTS